MQNHDYSRHEGETVLRWLTRLNAEGGRYYFTPETLAFFGSTDRRASVFPGGFLYTERQGKAPAGYPAWRAALFGEDGVDQIASATGHSRSEAIQNLRARVISLG